MNKSLKLRILILFLSLQPLAFSLLAAGAPQQITYQGTLRKAGAIYTGSVPMEFRITNADGSVVYWTSGSTMVYVSAGLFGYPLGTPNETQFAAIPWSAAAPYVRVTVDGLALPADPLLSTPYAFHSKTAGGSAGAFTLADGDLKISTTTGSRGIVFQDGSAQYTAAGNSLWQPWGINIYNSNSGNTGVGITLPASKLSVAGGLGLGAGYAGIAAPANGAIIEGNVGIGTTSPSQKLEVAGIVKGTAFQGDGSAVTNITAANITGGSFAGAGYSFSGNVAMSTITVSSITAGNMRVTGAFGGDVNAGGYKVTNLGLPGLGTDAVNKSYVDSLVGGGSPAAVLSATQTFTGQNAFQNRVTVSSNLFVINGSVGIGMTGPNYRLQVSSGAGEAGTIMTVSTGTSNLFWVAGDGAHAVKFFGDGSNLSNVTAVGAPPTGAAGGALNGTYPNPGLAASQAAAVTWSAAQTFSGGAGFPGSGIWNASGSIGVGTTGPGDKLDVQGGNIRNSALASAGNRCVYADSNGALHIKSDDCGLAGAGGDDLGNHTMAQNLRTSNYWVSNAGGNEGIFLQSGGNVGIGTTAPGAPLEVAGQVKITGGAPGANKVLTSDAAGLAAWQAAQGDGWGSAVVQTNATITGNGTAGSLLGLNLGNANGWTAAQSFSANTNFPGSGIWNTSGNVGIGTTGPGAKLDVAGDINIGANKLKTTNLFLKEFDANWLQIRNAADTEYRGLFLSNLYIANNGGAIHSNDTDSNYALFQARQNGVGKVEIGRMQNAADPYFKIGSLTALYSGNVGIGTTSPGQTLTVAGTGNITGILTLDSTPILSSGLISIVGSLGVRRSGGENPSLYTEQTNTALSPAVQGSWQIIGRDNGGGADTLVQVNGRMDTITAGAEDTSIHILLLKAGVQTEPMTILGGSGNVGIGTAGPLSNLHIKPPSGASELRVDTSIADVITRLSFYENGVDKWIIDNVGASSDILRFMSNGVSNILVLTQAGNVGIATTTPQGLFHVGAGATPGLLVTSAGNVGIGTTSPAAPLDVYKSAAGIAAQLVSPGTTETYFRIQNTSTGGRDWLIGSSGDGSGYGGGKLVFVDNSGGGGVRAVINNAGNVGIGTTNPGSRLTVESAVNTDVSSMTARRTAGTDVAFLKFYGENAAGAGVTRRGSLHFNKTNDAGDTFSSGAGSHLGLISDQGLILGSSGQGRMLIAETSGNVGIGTTGPEQLLHTVGTTGPRFERTTASTNNADDVLELLRTSSGDIADGFGGLLRFTIEDTAAVRNIIGQIGAVRSGTDTEGTLVFQAGTNGAEEFMRIKNDGNVGIGTISPGQLLHLQKNDEGIRISAASDPANYYTKLINNYNAANPFTMTSVGGGVSSTLIDVFGGNPSANLYSTRFGGSTNLYLATGGTDKVTVTSGGNVGIGTTSPSAKLDVKGEIRAGAASNGLMAAANGTLAASIGTLDLSINTGGGGFTGFLTVENARVSNAAVRTQTLYAVIGRGTSATFTSLATGNGGSGGSAFTLSVPSNGVIRMTNNDAGDSTTATMTWFGDGTGG